MTSFSQWELSLFLGFECNAWAVQTPVFSARALGVSRRCDHHSQNASFSWLTTEAESANMSTVKGNKPLIEGKARRLSAPARARAVRRPEDVVRDVRGLKLRQRVSLVLNDKVLRDELEDLVQNYVQNGPKTSGEGVRTYQDFLIPSSTYYGGGMSAVVSPIADIRGSDTLNYSKQERLLRCKLASTYRLVDLFGWTTGIYSFITVSMNQLGPFLLVSICYVFCVARVCSVTIPFFFPVDYPRRVRDDDLL